MFLFIFYSYQQTSFPQLLSLLTPISIQRFIPASVIGDVKILKNINSLAYIPLTVSKK